MNGARCCSGFEVCRVGWLFKTAIELLSMVADARLALDGSATLALALARAASGSLATTAS